MSVRGKEIVTQKVSIFNPGGLILKIIFAIVIPVLRLRRAETASLWESISSFVFMFLIVYALASMLGFAINVTNNYLAGIIVFLLLVVGSITVLAKAVEFMGAYGRNGMIIVQLVAFACVVCPIYKDVKKASIYFKQDA